MALYIDTPGMDIVSNSGIGTICFSNKTDINHALKINPISKQKT